MQSAKHFKKKQPNNELFHKLFSSQNHYDFYNAEKTIKDFIASVETKFVSKEKFKVQGSMELMNYQPAEEIDQLVVLESRRTWLADVYVCFYFKTYVQTQISSSFMKRVIINGMTGSRWRFKRFESLSVIVTFVDTGFVLA